MDNPRKEEEELTAKTWSLASWDRSQVPGWTWVRSSIIPGWKGVTGQQRTEVTGHILALAQKTSLTVRRLCSNNWKDLVSAPSCWGRRWCRGWGARPSPATGSCCTAPWSATTTLLSAGKWARTWLSQHQVPRRLVMLRSRGPAPCFDAPFVRLWFMFLSNYVCAKPPLCWLEHTCCCLRPRLRPGRGRHQLWRFNGAAVISVPKWYHMCWSIVRYQCHNMSQSTVVLCICDSNLWINFLRWILYCCGPFVERSQLVHSKKGKYFHAMSRNVKFAANGC